MTRVLPADRICNQIISIEWGSSYRIDDLAERLVAVGYRREAMVESPGEFSIRGTILDVYPCEGDAPWRLDFFGEELESIRKFDPATQRSAGTAA
ncbi:hypothetical protein HYR69_08015 [Candidatus Sumerlaeota bacterium]|nr:hypothetical protein [Candidatus Sumerlaeota bacterium]